ncbi:hypothetical protein [Dongia deserti]|uniref:hypothetical protein n=1 Tax=Dongia deserti TaxID=2268030 RepID=UPI000E65294E|nr:hypothetical protein [Dongia deserti]
MIHFVTTRPHGTTLRFLIPRLGRSRCRDWYYDDVFRRKKLPSGTWIFTDHERLSPFELTLAARVAFHLERGGARILNHPARVLRRFDLLRTLKAAGINDFSAWRAESSPKPDSFPVFIRNEYDHWLGDPPLIPDQATLQAELAALQRSGYPLVGKLVIEYAGEEVSPGVWQRLQTYHIGGETIAHTNVMDFKWVAKDVKDMKRLESHPLFDHFIAKEQEFISKNLYADVLSRAFELAGIDYGRADFAIVNGKPQIYEINTNPYHGDHEALFRTIHPRRAAIQKYSEDLVEKALLKTDLSADGTVKIKDPMLQRYQAWWKPRPEPVWRP